MKEIHLVTLGEISTSPSFNICMDFSVFVTITHHQSDHWSQFGGHEHQLVIKGSILGYINDFSPRKVDRRWDFDEISNSLHCKLYSKTENKGKPDTSKCASKVRFGQNRSFWPNYKIEMIIYGQRHMKSGRVPSIAPVWSVDQASFKRFYSASVMAVKKVIPSDSNSPSKIENQKSSSIPAQNPFFSNILGKIMASETFTSLIWIIWLFSLVQLDNSANYLGYPRIAS